MPGFHEITYQSILKCDVDIRKNVVSGIVLAGGNTLIPKFKESFEEGMPTIWADERAVRQIVREREQREEERGRAGDTHRDAGRPGEEPGRDRQGRRGGDAPGSPSGPLSRSAGGVCGGENGERAHARVVRPVLDGVERVGTEEPGT